MTSISRTAQTVTDGNFAGELRVAVREIRPQNNGNEISILIRIENGASSEQKRLLLTAGQYCELKPVIGEIDEEEYERLETAARLFLAIRCGENLLSYGSNSARTLTQKIIRHGYPRETAEAAVAALSEMGLIDEERDMEREVERCLARLWGEKRILARLWERGFSVDATRRLPELLAEVDFAAQCAKLLRRHYGDLPDAPDEQRRMFAFLTRNGYTYDQIRRAIRALSEER